MNTAAQPLPQLAEIQQMPEAERHAAYVQFILEDTDYDNQGEDIQWHIRRRLGIGGSDVGAILGINPYKTPYDVWLEKTGRELPADLSDNDAVLAGTLLEDAVAKFYEIREGKKVRRWNGTRFHKTMPWLAGNVDRIVEGERRILECKTAGEFAKGWGEPGTDEVPETYLLQVTHYMGIWGYDEGDLAVLTGGQKYSKYTIPFDAELFEEVADHLTRFWFDNVIGDVAPDPSSLIEIERTYRNDNGEAITADTSIVVALESRDKLKAQHKELGEQIKEQEVAIKGYMGEHAVLLGQRGDKLATWKTQQARRFDSTAFKKAHPDLHAEFTKVSESRVFRA